MEYAKNLLKAAKSIQESADTCFVPPVEITPTDKYIILSPALFKSTRGYLENIVYQINTCYAYTCYDACSVMIRRLVEILIIETYENHNLENRIKNGDGDFFPLDNLINCCLSEPTWNLARNSKRGLRELKNIGDLSAHSRRYNTNRHDLDKRIQDLRVVVEELLYLAGLKK